MRAKTHRRMTTNLELNRRFHDQIYRETDPAEVVRELRDALTFQNMRCHTYSHWKGAIAAISPIDYRVRVFWNLGAGAGHNALLMAQLGAQVTAVDITEHSAPLQCGGKIVGIAGFLMLREWAAFF